jgi:hypothetical protein
MRSMSTDALHSGHVICREGPVCRIEGDLRPVGLEKA